MRPQVLAILAVATGCAVAQTQYTATDTADVYAAQATAETESPTSNVKGKVFDRLAIIWLENTDYDLAVGDVSLVLALGLCPFHRAAFADMSRLIAEPGMVSREGHHLGELLRSDASFRA